MKSLFGIIILAIITMMFSIAGAADPAAVAVVPAVTAAGSMTGIITWMQSNQVIVGGLLIAVLDFIFAINPAWKSNGALHFLYTVASRQPTIPAA